MGDEDTRVGRVEATVASATDDEPWDRTQSEMEELAAGMEAAGWDVLSFSASAVGFGTRSDGEGDGYGVVFAVPEDVAPGLEEFTDGAEFPQVYVYGRTVDGRRFTLLRFEDAETDRCFLVASSYPVENAERLRPDAEEAGVLPVRFSRVVGEEVAAFQLEDPELLFEDPE